MQTFVVVPSRVQLHVPTVSSPIIPIFKPPLPRFLSVQYVVQPSVLLAIPRVLHSGSSVFDFDSA